MGQKGKKILLIEPFFTGSHAQWVKELAKLLPWEVHLLTLPGRHWKWRMHGAALTLAIQAKSIAFVPDLILCTEMLDLAQFLAYVRKDWGNVPAAVYFHENQLTYPWSKTDPDIGKRDNHYAYLNYSTALAADHVFFNSEYHRNSFLEALPSFLSQFPDFTHPETVGLIKEKSSVLPLGLHLQVFRGLRSPHPSERPRIVWNHRWEYDKQPERFFETLLRLQREGHAFDLIVMGQHFAKVPPIFANAKRELEQGEGVNILQWGYAESIEAYRGNLAGDCILPVTSQHDFFGISVVEAIAAGCSPLLPNRLAYPEHIPSHLHPEFLYNTDQELYEKLAKWLETRPDPRECRDFVVHKYDWRALLPTYLDALERLMH